MAAARARARRDDDADGDLRGDHEARADQDGDAARRVLGRPLPGELLARSTRPPPRRWATACSRARATTPSPKPPSTRSSRCSTARCPPAWPARRRAPCAPRAGTCGPSATPPSATCTAPWSIAQTGRDEWNGPIAKTLGVQPEKVEASVGDLLTDFTIIGGRRLRGPLREAGQAVTRHIERGVSSPDTSLRFQRHPLLSPRPWRGSGGNVLQRAGRRAGHRARTDQAPDAHGLHPGRHGGRPPIPWGD